MKEAQRQLEKASTANKEMKQKMLRDRVATIEKFVQAREALNAGDAQTMATLCIQLTDQPGVEEAIRLGDVFAQLVEHFYGQR